MNRLEGRIAFVRGGGAVKVVGIDTPAGRLHALVLDTGSSERVYAAGMRASVLFKETSVVVLERVEPSLAGKVTSLVRGEVLVSLEITLEPSGILVRAHLPTEEIPPILDIGDGIRLHVPASATSLELS